MNRIKFLIFIFFVTSLNNFCCASSSSSLSSSSSSSGSDSTVIEDSFKLYFIAQLDKLKKENIDIKAQLDKLKKENIDIKAQLSELKQENIGIKARLEVVQYERQRIKEQLFRCLGLLSRYKKAIVQINKSLNDHVESTDNKFESVASRFGEIDSTLQENLEGHIRSKKKRKISKGQEAYPMPVSYEAVSLEQNFTEQSNMNEPVCITAALADSTEQPNMNKSACITVTLDESNGVKVGLIDEEDWRAFLGVALEEDLFK